jgi:hypothetical protein
MARESVQRKPQAKDFFPTGGSPWDFLMRFDSIITSSSPTGLPSSVQHQPFAIVDPEATTQGAHPERAFGRDAARRNVAIGVRRGDRMSLSGRGGQSVAPPRRTMRRGACSFVLGNRPEAVASEGIRKRSPRGEPRKAFGHAVCIEHRAFRRFAESVRRASRESCPRRRHPAARH